MYRRNLPEKIRRLEKEVGDGDKKAKKELLINYRKYGKLKEYFKLLATIRPLKDEEIYELLEATWAEFSQQALICDAQNTIDDSLLEEILAFVETEFLERINTPEAGVICWHCDDSCKDFQNGKSGFLNIIRFIKQHQNCHKT